MTAGEGSFLFWGKDTRAKSTGPVLIQNLLILSTIQKISGKQREVLVCALSFHGRQEGVKDRCMTLDLKQHCVVFLP